MKVNAYATRELWLPCTEDMLLDAASGRMSGGGVARTTQLVAADAPPTSPVHLWKRDSQMLPLISTQSGQQIVVAFPDSLGPTILNFTDYLEGSHGTKAFPGHAVRRMPYRQSASCQDERHIVEAMTTASLGVIFMHNFDVGGDMLIHTLFSEQISLVDAVAEATKLRIARGSMRLLVISVENPYDLRFLLSTAAGRTSTASRSGHDSP